MSDKNRKDRGFAVMDPDTQRQIASLGGRIAHSMGHAHEFTPEEAKVAGRKGGLISSQNRKNAKSSFYHQVQPGKRR
jgi:uncharacterized protein